ncbi:MAG: hypothetical protein V3R35_09495 [Woeseiaceae bacterium]
MLLTGTGFDVMRRIAAPMVGGMLTTTVLCLLVLPIIYTFVLQHKEKRFESAGLPVELNSSQGAS